MQISNETKVGALTVISVTLLVLGYNFLKGKTLTRKTNLIYARFSNVGALENSSPVKINGFKIGNVYDISAANESVSEVIVGINLEQKVQIPENSTATILNNITGTTSLQIVPGNSKQLIKLGDTLSSNPNPDIMSTIMNNLTPVMTSIKTTVDSLQHTVKALNQILNTTTQNHIKDIAANLNKSSESLSILLDEKEGSLAKTLKNTEQFTAQLNKESSNIRSIISNLKTTSDELAAADIKTSVERINATLTDIREILQKAKSKEGSLGLLLNDPKLYNNLQQTSRSLTILLDDIKTHPKRYINVSVFGKKDKSKPLVAPLADSAQNGSNE
ncbi:MAG: MCE family protein [Bacteroidetes bacterium]|nr:MCE family protein [Bacteroidota bacterium]